MNCNTVRILHKFFMNKLILYYFLLGPTFLSHLPIINLILLSSYIQDIPIPKIVQNRKFLRYFYITYFF